MEEEQVEEDVEEGELDNKQFDKSEYAKFSIPDEQVNYLMFVSQNDLSLKMLGIYLIYLVLICKEPLLLDLSL